MHLTSQDVKANMTRLEEPEYLHTERVADNLKQTVFGQDEACQAVARRVAIFDAELNDSNRPLGVEMFLGSTGVGKTEMAHALAEYLFDDRDSEQLMIIDCAEFAQEHSIHKLIGAPPSYVGYGAEPLITEDFLSKRNIIVFDEIEKANPALHKLLLGVMEDARMGHTASGKEKQLNFNQSLIIMTSNVGAREVDEAVNGKGDIGFSNPNEQKDSYTDIKSISTQALKNTFAPEFINRIDDVVVFKNLEPEHYDRIFYKFIDEINNGLKERNEQAPFIGATVEFKDFILNQIDRRYGARDMRRQIDKELLEGLADVFMSMDMRLRPIVADREDDKTYFYTLDNPELPDIEDFDYENAGYEFLPEEDDDMFYGAEHEEDKKPEEPEWVDQEADVTDPPKEPDTPKNEIILPPNRTVDISVRIKNNNEMVESVTVYDLPLFPSK